MQSIRKIVTAPPVAAVRSVHFSSATNEWETPQFLFDELKRYFSL